MIFTKLKLKGFKSFVEPTELLFKSGLTGIVGPNGCGKSNLVEALRFVMGELSPKQMRGQELDDVIFNGTSNKAPWDIAEVTVELDNKDRKAPTSFNNNNEIEVTRRIWRGEGSEYRVNGKAVRLRDVQLIFADASTGARSTSIVSQDRVAAIIIAKPEQRRALLEEAAGITGLHTRRHEAELRLNAASTNLDRVKDIFTAQQTLLQSLKKQSRQAKRYKNIQNDIRRLEAGIFYQKWTSAEKILEEDKKKLNFHEEKVIEQTRGVAKINTEFEGQQNKIPEIRIKDNDITTELQRYNINLENYKKDIDKLKISEGELQIRLKQIEDDIIREEKLADNAKINLSKVQIERNKLEQQGDLFPDKYSTTSKVENEHTSPIIDYLDFDDGLEKALASVFKDDLFASIDTNQSSHWKKFNTQEKQSDFPKGIIPLKNLLKAPDNLQKKMSYIGLVENRENINEIQGNLRDGEVLVSKEGEIWRWDGFTSDGKQSASIKAVVEQLKNRRIKELLKEEGSWQKIVSEATIRIEELIERKNKITIEVDNLKLKPDQISEEQEKLIKLITETKKIKGKTSSILTTLENELNELNKKLKLEEVKLRDLREEKVRLEGVIATHIETINQISERIKESLNCSPDELLKIGEINETSVLPSIEELEEKLEKIHQERERLGGVNLLAEQEATELEETVEKIRKEHDDLLEAITKLRDGISQLNKEGRQRLLAAYGVVNENFQKLFARLFGGGKAYLKFTDESDPLESGLEVYTSPPGKKLQNLSLLSGGEKSLTALSLLFAVFLSNPAPICVLDEVDAALDDTNVDRFCSLVEEITSSINTKFLIVTHHRMTMARVNRLFGVTMPEQGISKLVSVELEEATQIAKDE